MLDVLLELLLCIWLLVLWAHPSVSALMVASFC
jgi:hypothetical protein